MMAFLYVTINLQSGATALFIASERGHNKIVQSLIAAGASLDVQLNVSCFINSPYTEQ